MCIKSIWAKLIINSLKKGFFADKIWFSTPVLDPRSPKKRQILPSSYIHTMHTTYTPTIRGKCHIKAGFCVSLWYFIGHKFHSKGSEALILLVSTARRTSDMQQVLPRSQSRRAAREGKATPIFHVPASTVKKKKKKSPATVRLFGSSATHIGSCVDSSKAQIVGVNVDTNELNHSNYLFIRYPAATREDWSLNLPQNGTKSWLAACKISNYPT